MDLNKLKYHPKWIEFGFVSKEEILEQNIEFDKGEDPNDEHYRHHSFQKWYESKESFTNLEIERLFILVDLDDCQFMTSSIVGRLFDSKKITAEQYEIIKSKLANYGNWAIKKIERKEFYKNVKRNPDSLELFEKCKASEDNILKMTFISHSGRRDFIEEFTKDIYSRKIRNLANQKLRNTKKNKY